MTAWWPRADDVQEYAAPGRIVSGRGAVGRLAAMLAADPGGHDDGAVLVVVDDVVHDSGALDAALRGLRETGLRVTIVGGLGAEPVDTVIDEAAATARSAGAGTVVGIGGGSVLDAAKLLALLVRNEGRVAEWLGPVDPPSGVAPLVLVPTTCGTGSEANRHAIVTSGGAKRWSSSSAFLARAVILDPQLLDAAPRTLIAATGMDALSHAVESAMSTTSSPMTVHHSLRAIELLVGSLEAAAAGDRDARAACLWGAHLAGRALNAGVVLGHSMAYSLAHAVPLPHGVSSGFALPYCIAYNAGHLAPDRAAAIARALTGGASEGLRDAAETVRDLAIRVGLPATIGDMGVPAGAERELAVFCAREYPRPNNPAPIDPVALDGVFRAMRTGDLQAAFRSAPVSA